MSFNIFIPSVGMKFVVLEDAKVELPNTYEGIGYADNVGLIKDNQVTQWYKDYNQYLNKNHVPRLPEAEVFLPKGTVFSLNKIYVRNDGWNHDYVTIKVYDNPNFKRVIPVSLGELSKIDVDFLGDENEQ